MLNFICLNGIRIHKNTIKKYRPEAANGIYIYYSPSRNKIDSELFKFDSEEERDEALNLLDNKL